MPVRRNTVEKAVEVTHGGPWMWNAVTGETSADGWSRQQHDDAVAQLDAAYETLVRATDWNRVMLEASSWCLTADCAHTYDTNDLDPAPCGLGVKYALLNPGRFGLIDDDDPLLAEMVEHVRARDDDTQTYGTTTTTAPVTDADPDAGADTADPQPGARQP